MATPCPYSVEVWRCQTHPQKYPKIVIPARVYSRADGGGNENQEVGRNDDQPRNLTIFVIFIKITRYMNSYSGIEQ